MHLPTLPQPRRGRPHLVRRVPAGRPPQRHARGHPMRPAPGRTPGRRRLLRRADAAPKPRPADATRPLPRSADRSAAVGSGTIERMPTSAARAATDRRRSASRRPVRRRHPPARLDQRPRRADRRPDRRAVQRARHQPVLLAGAARPRLRRTRRVLEPPRHRRLRAARATPSHVEIEHFVEDGALGDGPLRHRPGRADGLVDGRQHDVRARGPPPRAGDAACSPCAGVPGDTFAHHARRRFRCRTSSPEPLTVNVARVLKHGGWALSPVTLAAARRAAHDRPADSAHRLHVPDARPGARRPWRSRSSYHARATGTSTSR